MNDESISDILKNGLMESPFGAGQDTTFCGPGACSANEASDKLALMWSRYASFVKDWLVNGVAPGSLLTSTKGEVAVLFGEDQGVGSFDPLMGARANSDTNALSKKGALTNTCAAFVIAAMRILQRGVFVNGTAGLGSRRTLAYLAQTTYYDSALMRALFQSSSMRLRSEYQGCQKEFGIAEIYQSSLGVSSSLTAMNGQVSVQYPAPALRCLCVIPSSQVSDQVDMLWTLDHDAEVEAEGSNPPTTTQTVKQFITVIWEGFAVPAMVGLCGDLSLQGGRIVSGGMSVARG